MPMPQQPLSSGDVLPLDASILIIGGPGAGKTSAVAPSVMAPIWKDEKSGGLVICPTAEDVQRLAHDILAAGRGNDLVRLSAQQINLMAFFQQAGMPVMQQVHILSEAMQTVARLESAGGDAQNWRQHMETSLLVVFTLIRLARVRPGLQLVHDVVRSAPEKGDPARVNWWKRSVCAWLILRARHFVARARHPLARHDLKQVEDFLLGHWARLNERTKSSINQVFFSFFASILSGELYQRFGTGRVTFDLRATHHGKILLCDIPLELGAGAVATATILKASWQTITRARPMRRGEGLTFCYADESPLIASQADAAFLGVARNKQAIMVYVCQSLPQMQSILGKETTFGLFANFRSKFFVGGAADPATAEYAANLAGKGYAEQITTSEQTYESSSGTYGWLPFLAPKLGAMLGQVFSYTSGQGTSSSEQYRYQVEPAELFAYRSGGPENDGWVDALLIRTSWRFANGKHFIKLAFRQPARHRLLPRLGQALLAPFRPARVAPARSRRPVHPHRPRRSAP